MIILLSPAKTLDLESNVPKLNYTEPIFQDEALELAKTIIPLGEKGLRHLMNLSDKLAHLNSQRFLTFKEKPDTKSSRPAIFSFNGGVYESLNVKSFSENDIYYAQKKLRIISGLYGLLKPLDLIQPYRLEMGTKLQNIKGKNLYEWWGNKLANELIHDSDKQKNQVIVNLASEEYFKSISKYLTSSFIWPVFQDFVAGEYKTIGIFAKKARGLMASYIIKNKVEKIVDLKRFNHGGYKFDFEEPLKNKLFFRRKK